MQVATQINVQDLKIDDSVDLEHDKYISKESTIHEFQYAQVEEIEELDDGVLVVFSTATIKFPYNHLVYKIDGA
jgi:hypothetical protein